jgi:hypothetical protein
VEHVLSSKVDFSRNFIKGQNDILSMEVSFSRSITTSFCDVEKLAPILRHGEVMPNVEAPVLRFFATQDDIKIIEKLASQYVFRQQKSSEAESGIWVNEFFPNTYEAFLCSGREFWQLNPSKLIASSPQAHCLENSDGKCRRKVEKIIMSNNTPLSFIDFSLYWIMDYVRWEQQRDLMVISKRKLAEHGLKPVIPVWFPCLPEERIIQPVDANPSKKLEILHPEIPKDAYVRIPWQELPKNLIPQDKRALTKEHHQAAEMLSGLKRNGYAYFWDVKTAQNCTRRVHWFYSELIDRCRSGEIALS